jgi:hypothetical protein
MYDTVQHGIGGVLGGVGVAPDTSDLLNVFVFYLQLSVLVYFWWLFPIMIT